MITAQSANTRSIIANVLLEELLILTDGAERWL
jgi:hypothetical protein